MTNAPVDRPDRTMLVLRVVLAAALLAGGLVAAGFAWTRADRAASQAEAAEAEGVAERTASTVMTVIAGMGGAAALVPVEGPVLPETFEAFRLDVAQTTHLETLGYVAIVRDEERSTFETFLGRPITDLDGSRFVVAPQRATYWPVRLIGPPDPVTAPLLGLDVGASPLTSELARSAVDTGRTVLTEPAVLGSELTVFFVLKPLYRPGSSTTDVASRRAAHAGLLASALTGQALGEGIASGLSDEVRFSVSDGSVPLAGSSRPPGVDAPTVDVGVAGRTWTVVVEDTRPADHDLAWFLLGLTLLIVGGLLYLALRSARYERAVARIARLVGSTADVAQQLAGAATAEEVAEVIDSSVGTLFGASGTLVDLEAGHGPESGLEAERADAVRTRDVVVGERGRHAVALLPLESEDRQVVAFVEIVRADRTGFDDVDRAALRTIAELCEQSLRRAAATDRAALRADQFARLAGSLAGATTVLEVSERITDLGRRPVAASAASIGLIDRSAGVLRVNHGPQVTDEVKDRYANPPLESRLVFTDAARTGQVVVVHDAEEYARRYPESEDATASLGAAARAGLPLRADGEAIGAIVFSWETPQRFDDAMMSNLATIAEMATQSVLRARLAEKHLDEARRSRDLAEFARRVARVWTVDGLVAAVMAYGGVAVGSVVTNLGLIDAEDGRLVVQPARGFPTQLVEEFGPRLLDDDLPGMTAIRSGEPVVMGTPEEIARCQPGRFADAAATAGIRSTAHLPLVGADAAPLGAIGFGWADPREFSDTTMATLFTIAELCAQTLERVRLGEAEHDLVSSLQHRVVRPLPPAPGLSLAQRYRPAAHSVGMGGDWYEGILLVDGRYAVVVGDIAGHGIAAVADMIQVRTVVGALLRGGVPLGDVFPQATGLLDDRRSTVTATAGIVVVDPAAEELSYVMAGHLPPVVIAPGGGARFLNDGRQPLLGLPIAPVLAGSAPFPAGSTLIAYTDGLIERRTESIDRSLQRVLDAAGSSPDSTPQAMADHLLATCLAGEDPDDDVALVVVRLDI